MSIIYTIKMFNSMARMIKHAEKVSGVDNLNFNKMKEKGENRNEQTYIFF